MDLTYWPDRETYRRIRGDYAHLDEGLVAAMCDANREASASENVRWRQVRGLVQLHDVEESHD